MTEDNTMTPTIEDAVITGSIPVTMKFLDAMAKILDGKKVARISWANKDYCLIKDGWIDIFIKGDFHAWNINDGDYTGQDWVVIKETN